MTSLPKILLAVIVVEVLLGSILCWQRTQRWEPPLPNLGKLDDETAEAIQTLRSRTRDGSFTRWRELGESYLGSGFYTAAEQCFGISLTLNPADLQSKYCQGFCLERTGRTSDAIPVLKAVAESETADADLVWTCWYQVGRCYLREENVADAEKAFRRIADFSPAVYQLAKLLIRTDRVGEALSLIDEQLEQYPNDVKFLQLKGKAAAALKDLKTVAEMRDREDRAEYIVEMEYGGKFIGGLSTRFGLGSRLSRALELKSEGTPEQQAAALNGALAVIRRHHFWNYRSVFVAMAELEVETGNPEGARTLIAEIRQFSQDGADLLELEGKAFLAEGRKSEAAAVWRRTLKMKPSIEVLQALISVSEDADVRIRLQAEEVFRRGLAEFSKNRVENSLPYFEKATELDSATASFFYYLADAKRVLGNKSASEAAFAECLKINPDHGRALRHRELLAQK